MDIQNLKQTDIKFIHDLLPFGWEDVVSIIDWYTHTSFCYPIKVCIDKKIIGVGAAIIHNKSAWLAHIIVHADFRKQGIGKKITETLVDTSHSKGCETIYLLATDLGEPVYRKIGFEIETEYMIYKCEAVSGLFKGNENIVAISSQFKKQILDLDRQASGEDRILVLEQHLSDGFLFLKDNEVQGFYMPNLGNGLIIASTDMAGVELMKLRFQSKDFAAFPIENLKGTEFMKQNNFKEDRSEKRMRLGKKRNWQPQNIYNSIGGNLG
ncbi:MAG: GNAT family N-acetyltransferase [Ignavibacteria bacterium]